MVSCTGIHHSHQSCSSHQSSGVDSCNTSYVPYVRPVISRACSSWLAGLQVSYSSLQGIALLLMLGYTMYDLVFDAKLGIIARTLYRAMPDLAHYVDIAMLLVTGVTMASHVTLGPMLPAFETFEGQSLSLLLPVLLMQCRMHSYVSLWVSD